MASIAGIRKGMVNYGAPILTGISAYRQATGGVVIAGATLVAWLAQEKIDSQQYNFLNYLTGYRSFVSLTLEQKQTLDLSSAAMTPFAIMGVMKLAMRIFGRPLVIPTGVCVLGVMGLVAFAVMVVKVRSMTNLLAPMRQSLILALTSPDDLSTKKPNEHYVVGGPDAEGRYAINDDMKSRYIRHESKCKTEERISFRPDRVKPLTFKLNKVDFTALRFLATDGKIGILNEGGQFNPIKCDSPAWNGVGFLFDLDQAIKRVCPTTLDANELSKMIIELFLSPQEIEQFLSSKIANLNSEIDSVGIDDGFVIWPENIVLSIAPEQDGHKLTISRSYSVRSSSHRLVFLMCQHVIQLLPNTRLEDCNLQTHFQLLKHELTTAV
jgi:hypothetical protein